MSVTRSRIGSFSSPVSTASASYDGKAKVFEADDATDVSRRNIWTVASPESISEPDWITVGGFLEQCHYCRKRMAQNSEVFMYGIPFEYMFGCQFAAVGGTDVFPITFDLCAFCSDECREFQIAHDLMAEKEAAITKQRAVQGQKIHNLKGWLGS